MPRAADRKPQSNRRKQKESLLDVPMREALQRLQKGASFTEADNRSLAEMNELDRQAKSKHETAFKKRIESIAPWFHFTSYGWSRLSAVLSKQFPAESLSTWMDLTDAELFGVVDGITNSVADASKYPGFKNLYREMKAENYKTTYEQAAKRYHRTLDTKDRPTVLRLRRWLERPENH